MWLSDSGSPKLLEGKLTATWLSFGPISQLVVKHSSGTTTYHNHVLPCSTHDKHWSSFVSGHSDSLKMSMACPHGSFLSNSARALWRWHKRSRQGLSVICFQHPPQVATRMQEEWNPHKSTMNIQEWISQVSHVYRSDVTFHDTSEPPDQMKWRDTAALEFPARMPCQTETLHLVSAKRWLMVGSNTRSRTHPAWDAFREALTWSTWFKEAMAMACCSTLCLKLLWFLGKYVGIRNTSPASAVFMSLIASDVQHFQHAKQQFHCLNNYTIETYWNFSFHRKWPRHYEAHCFWSAFV